MAKSNRSAIRFCINCTLTSSGKASSAPFFPFFGTSAQYGCHVYFAMAYGGNDITYRHARPADPRAPPAPTSPLLPLFAFARLERAKVD